MKKQWKINNKEWEAIENALENILGYCGTWSKTDVIEVKTIDGRSVSMRIDVFLDSLKREFIISQ